MGTAVAIPGGGGIGAGELQSSGGDIFNDIGSSLSAAWDEASSGGQPESEAPAGEAGNEASLPTEGDGETPLGEEAAAEVTPEAAEEPAPAPAAPPEKFPYPLTPDGKALLVPKGDFAGIQQAREFQKAVGQFFQSPQEAQLAHQQATDLRMMGRDWMYGTPDSVRGVLMHFAGANQMGPMSRMKYQASFGRMATMLPDVLSQTNPQAFQGFVAAMAQHPQVAEGVQNTIIEQAYAEAARIQDPQQRADGWRRAQEMEYGIRGRYKGDNEIPSMTPHPAELKLQQQQQQFQQQQAAALNRDITTFRQGVIDAPRNTQINTDLDKLLAPLKSRYSEAAFNDLRRGVGMDLEAGLKANQEWWIEHQQIFDGIMQDFRGLWETGQSAAALKPRIDAYVSSFASQAKKLLPSIVQKRSGPAPKPRVNGKAAVNGRPAAPAAAPGQQPNGKSNSLDFEKDIAQTFAQFR